MCIRDRKKGADGKFEKPVPSLLDTDTGQYFRNNPLEDQVVETTPTKQPLSEFSITELRNQERKLEKENPTPQLRDQNIELQNIKTEIAERDRRMVDEGPTERFDRLRGEDISYSETTPDVDPDSVQEVDQVIDAIDAENPKSLSAPVLQKVMDGIMSNFDQLKIEKIKFTTADRNTVLASKLKKLREQFPDVDDQALYDRARLDSTGVGAFVDNRPDKQGAIRVVLVPENIRGKTNEEVTVSYTHLTLPTICSV